MKVQDAACRLPETPLTKNNKGSRRSLHADTIPQCCARHAGHRAQCESSPPPTLLCLSLGECPSQAVQTTASGYRIFRSSPLLDGYDEPTLRRYSIKPFCLKGAADKHLRQVISRRPGN